MTQTSARLQHNVPLSRYCSWRVGGVAQRLYKPIDLNDCQQFLQSLPVDEPVTWLGLGSNCLIRDGGIRGTVIISQGALTTLKQTQSQHIYAGAGVACGQLARFASRRGLVGGEFWVGIPGTVGGALALNAGCGGSETWPLVHSVEVMNRQGHIECLGPEHFVVKYRAVEGLDGRWFVGATFAFASGDISASQDAIHQHLAHRTQTQPTNQPSCGSVFRNPEGDHAGRLIEACGLKGYHVGGAQVSEKHANFIVNTGGATAADIEQLIQHIEARVHEQHGVVLMREVHILGEVDTGVIPAVNSRSSHAS